LNNFKENFIFRMRGKAQRKKKECYDFIRQFSPIPWERRENIGVQGSKHESHGGSMGVQGKYRSSRLQASHGK
jgi:hypothetical protein